MGYWSIILNACLLYTSKEKYGLDVELVGFSGSLLPNDATNHGELDANVFQHRPFLEQDNQAPRWMSSKWFRYGFLLFFLTMFGLSLIHISALR